MDHFFGDLVHVLLVLLLWGLGAKRTFNTGAFRDVEHLAMANVILIFPPKLSGLNVGTRVAHDSNIPGVRKELPLAFLLGHSFPRSLGQLRHWVAHCQIQLQVLRKAGQKEQGAADEEHLPSSHSADGRPKYQHIICFILGKSHVYVTHSSNCPDLT